MIDIETLNKVIDTAIKLGETAVTFKPQEHQIITDMEIMVYRKTGELSKEYTLDEAIAKAIELNLDDIKVLPVSNKKNSFWVYAKLDDCNVIISTNHRRDL